MKKKRIVASNKDIQKSIVEMTKTINEDYKGLSVDIVNLNHAASFLIKDMLNYLDFDIRLQSLEFEANEIQSVNGEVKITRDIKEAISGRHVILLDGIIISGLTHYYICNYLKQKSPESIAISCVGIKPKQIVKTLPKYYSMFEFNEEWIEGYGIGAEPSRSKPYLIDSKKFV